MKSFIFFPLAAGFIWASSFVFCAEPVIPDDHSDGKNNASLPVERLQDFKIGKSTLADVHRIFGLREYARSTYKKKQLPKLYRRKAYDIYRLVYYTSHSVNRKELPGLIETAWQESLDITFFFDKKDILLLYTVRHRHNDGNGKDHAGKYHNIEGNPDEMWPGSVCDVMFHGIYETQRYKGSEYFGPVTTQKCSWLDQLKADVASGVVK